MPTVTPYEWVSVDPSKNATGIAVWDRYTPLYVGTLRPITATEIKATKKQGYSYTKQAFAFDQYDFRTAERSVEYLVDLHAALSFATCHAARSMMVIEHSMGFAPKSVAEISWRRGYMAALVALQDGVTVEVNTSSWRKVVGETFDVSFPNNSELAKALALKLVKEHFNVDLGDRDDEADALLIGYWAARCRVGLL